MTLQAYHNDAAVKTKYLARVDAHIKADNLLRGATGGDGKGCAVWCTLDAYEHSRYPDELGIPEWLAHVEDRLFEGMSLDKSRTWPLDFLTAIKPGADLEAAKAPFLIIVLKSALDSFDHDRFPAVAKAVQGSIALWEREDIGSSDWLDTARAAEEAAWAARAAAWAARAAKYDYFADELLKILRSIDSPSLQKQEGQEGWSKDILKSIGSTMGTNRAVRQIQLIRKASISMLRRVPSEPAKLPFRIPQGGAASITSSARSAALTR